MKRLRSEPRLRISLGFGGTELTARRTGILLSEEEGLWLGRISRINGFDRARNLESLELEPWCGSGPSGPRYSPATRCPAEGPAWRWMGAPSMGIAFFQTLDELCLKLVACTQHDVSKVKEGKKDHDLNNRSRRLRDAGADRSPTERHCHHIVTTS